MRNLTMPVPAHPSPSPPTPVLVLILLASALMAGPMRRGLAPRQAGGGRRLDGAAQSDRRRHPALHRQKQIAGAVTLVARKGRVVHFEARA